MSFEDSLRGLETKIPVEVTTACRECGGTGAQPRTTPVICPDCHGRGVIAELLVAADLSGIRECEEASERC